METRFRIMNLCKKLHLNCFRNLLALMIQKEVYMFIPKPGENVLLLCKKCKHTFSGPCPQRLGLGLLREKMKDETKCPKCGSKKLILSPFVHY